MFIIFAVMCLVGWLSYSIWRFEHYDNFARRYSFFSELVRFDNTPLKPLGKWDLFSKRVDIPMRFHTEFAAKTDISQLKERYLDIGSFRKFLTVNPDKLCEGLSILQTEKSIWRSLPINETAWECVAEYVSGKDEADYSIFVSARGRDQYQISSLRFRFLQSDPLPGSAFEVRAQFLIEYLFSQIEWYPDSEIINKIKKLEEFEADYFGVKLKLFNDFNDSNIINILINFPFNCSSLQDCKQNS